ncbi:hypothetical protein [Calothrix sp. PCC 6303]|uniref:hypothetical protein n=1 Tax=Calothrix sp. PCC 6303 TaxID=1170562 RepID=UPI0002A0333A|nr:hypothetical protein [Calothrix sp. PCC 6303]AFZ00348.1 hypothetical protein Cal6303_1288 [Calothrix sp. PCC 6303]
MSKIEYPTLDLFIYNLTDGLKNEEEVQNTYHKFWLDLPDKLGKINLVSTINVEDSERLDFVDNQTVDGCYSRANFEDTDCLRFSCSHDATVELPELLSVLEKTKDITQLPQSKNFKGQDLPPGILSEEGYLGQTWMISGWLDSANNVDTENIAHKTYQTIILEKHQHQNVGKFLGATIYEMWRGSERWKGVEKNSHVLVVFYPDMATFRTAATFYNAWRYLFYCRHKILWAYEQARELKKRLLKKTQTNIIDISSLSRKNLHQLKADLQANIMILPDCVQDLGLLEVQQHTIEINLYNYEKQCQEFFPTEKFLEELRKTASGKYILQLEKDASSFRSTLTILENLTNTTRGMVEIQQAERERNINIVIAIAGIGLATSQIVSSVIIAQEPPPKGVPFYQTSAFQLSIVAGIAGGIVTGAIAIIFVRIVISIFKYFYPSK